MALTSQSIKNLKGGVSQQPDILRYPNQGAKQINGWSSESQGLQKRPPTIFTKRLGNYGAIGTKPLVHLINRDALEQYYVAFDGGIPKVWDLDGNSYTVRDYNGYADCENPREDLRLITVADYTFVVNRKKVVDIGSTLTYPTYPSLKRRAIIVCRGGQYGRTLSVAINGTQAATIVLPIGDNPSQVANMDAGWIASTIASQIPSAMGTGWTATSGRGYVLVTAPVDITALATADGYGDQLLSGFVYQVQTFNKLPLQGPDGYMVEITGESARTGDNYWVRYSTASKVWSEVAKPGIIAGLDNTTMPHGLVRAADGQFDWKPLTWDERKSGDDETNPMPSFVDGTINDVFFFRNRLGFLSGENVIMSRTAKYFNFFPPSVAVLSDDDPIDVAISHNRISILKYAVPFSEQLLLWSDQAQFVLSSNGPMSAKTIELDLTTEFDVSDGARPFGIGRGVYFAAPRASFTSIKRYYAIQDVSDVKSAEDVSAHVPSYIPNTVHAIHGSGTENFVSILSNATPERVFVYKFLYLDEILQQQSFSYWYFGPGTKVLAASCIGSFCYLMIDRPGGLMLERIEFTQGTKDYDIEPYRAFMDSKVVATLGSYDIDLNETYLDVDTIWGGTPAATELIYVMSQEGAIEDFQCTGEPGQVLTFKGDRHGEQVVVGRRYEFLYEFSKFLIKQTADDGSTSTEDIGRLQLRKAWINYEQSGFFTITVNNGSTEYVYPMTGGRLGEQVLGELSVGTGQRRFSIAGDARRQTVTITSDTPNPVNIIGCGWEGNYIRRSSGI